MKLKINFLFFIISILGLLACGAPEKKHSSLMTQRDSGNENTPDHLPPPPPVLRGPTQPDQSNPQKPNDTAPEFSFGFSFSSNDYNKNEATLRKLRKHRGKVEEFRDIKGQERNNAENEALEKRKEFDQKDKERQEAKKQRDKAGSEYNAAHNEAQIQEGRKDHAQSQVDRRGQQVQKAEENYRQASDAHKRLEKSLKSAQFALEKDTKELLLINNMLGSELIKGVEKQQLFEERRRALESQVVELQNHVDSLNRDLAWLEALERHQNSLEQPEQSPQPQELSNGPRMEPFQPATQAIALINDYKEQNPEAPTAPDFGSVKLSDTAEASAGVVAPGGVNITPDAVMKAALIARAAIQAPLPPHIKIMGAAAAGATGYAVDVQVYDRQLGIADGCDKTIEDGIECLKQLAQKAAEGIKKYSQDEIENAEYFDDNPLTKKFREEIQQSAPIPHAPAPAPSVFHEAEDIQPQTRSGQEPPKPTPPTAAQRPPAVPETTVGPASTPYSATSPHVSDGAAPTQRSEDWLKTRTLDEIFAGPPKSPREIKEWMEARRQARIEKYGHNASPYTAQENSNSRPLDLPLTPPQGVVESQPQTPPQASQCADRSAWTMINNPNLITSQTAPIVNEVEASSKKLSLPQSTQRYILAEGRAIVLINPIQDIEIPTYTTPIENPWTLVLVTPIEDFSPEIEEYPIDDGIPKAYTFKFLEIDGDKLELTEGDTLEDLRAAAERNKPLGRGSTGRTEPRNLQEQVAMLIARANPDLGNLTKDKIVLNDPRWPAKEGWEKWEMIFKLGINVENKKAIVIHYVYNMITGEFDDFKFKENVKDKE